MSHSTFDFGLSFTFFVTTSLDAHYRSQGYRFLCGIDEAGRGPLAGPVYAAAVILPRNHGIKGIDDSKKLSAMQREKLFSAIVEKAVAYTISFVSAAWIDRINILEATKKAMIRAVKALSQMPDLILIDALNLNIPEMPQVNLIDGDARSESIAAASILAKVSRDRYMSGLDRLYPEYGFAQHKGYGTAKHRAALALQGPCKEHRRSFAPVRDIL